MSIDFTVFKGSPSRSIVESTGHRTLQPTQALVKQTHSGICGTDLHYLNQDVVLGHEGVGVITELGADASSISDLKVGDRVGVGWMQKYCGRCRPCLTGHDSVCEQSEEFHIANNDQGTFGTGAAWDVSALYKIPHEVASEYAAPLMCAGSTIWGAMMRGGIKPFDRVGILGLGGLGHLAIQFIAKIGAEVVVFSGSEEKREEAMKFGATEFHAVKGVSSFEGKGIQPIDHLFVTSSSQPDYSLYMPLLAMGAQIYPLTVSFELTPMPLIPTIFQRVSIIGSKLCYRAEYVDMFKFVVRHNIRPKIQTFP